MTIKRKPAEKSTKPAPKKSPHKQGWRLALWLIMVLVWAGASIIVSQLAVGTIMTALLGVETVNQPVPTAFYSALSYALAMVLIIYVPAKVTIKWRITNRAGSLTTRSERWNIDRTELGLKGLPTWTDIGLAPVGLVVSLLLAAGVIWLFSFFPWFDAGQTQEVGFDLFLSGADKAVAFLTLVVIAPIAEEVIFRGWLYGKLRARTSASMSSALSVVLSTLLVSVLFGAIHLQWNVAVNVFALSLVLCGLREITGTIYAGILVHMLKNGLAFYLLYVVGIM